LALVAVAALGLAACSSHKKAASGAAGRPGGLQLGFLGALTGPNAQLGIDVLDSERLAVSQYNATKPGHTVTVDQFDSQGDPSQADTGASKLIHDKVVAVIGPGFSDESKAADPVFERARIPNVSASATATALAQNGWKYFHRVLVDESRQGPADANYLVKTLGNKSVAVVDDNSTYGAGLASAFAAQVTNAGGSIAVTGHLDPNGEDYVTSVDKVTSSHADAVFFGGYYDAAGRLIHQLRTAGFEGTFMSGDGSEDEGFISDAGGATYADGAYLSCPCADETSNPSAQSFVSAYTSMFGVAPAIYSAEAYDATNFVLAAIKAGNTTPTAINDYLSSNSFEGVTKTIKFLPDGNVTGGTIYMYKVENGKIVETTSAS
jgi:branched-chain amino acid transport system substrate-binding protein